MGLDSPAGRALLREAVELAISSRDLFRQWDGPADLAVGLAIRALLALDDPQRVVALASLAPEGEATALETNDPNVRRGLFWARLMLGGYDDIGAFSFEGLEPFDRAFMRGMLAVTGDDAAASSRMRRALALANDESSQRKALWGLAMVGEVDESSMADVSEADAALFRGMAALNRDDIPEAIDCLCPFWLESPTHAHCLALAHHQAGNLGEAIEVLIGAAGHCGVVSLYDHAVELLVMEGDLLRARSLATEALARDPSAAERQRLKGRLVDIAHALEDWSAMESYARSAATEFPHDQRAPWMVIYALYRQVKDQDAWDYILEKDLIPASAEMARLAIAVCQRAERPARAAERLLRIADMYPDTEDVVGSALVLLITRGERLALTEQQQTRLDEQVDDFLSRFPNSTIFGTHSVEGPEDIAEMMTSWLQTSAQDIHRVLMQVRYGHLPYGALQWHRADLPYMELLLSMAAGYLTAIPTDENRREEERQAARQALGGRVAVDTSVVALGMQSKLDLRRLGQVFQAVLVADELIVDARETVVSVRQSSSAAIGYNPVLGRLAFTKIDEDQRQADIEIAQSAVEVLLRWPNVNSGPLPSPVPLGEKERFYRPWDASIRVAASTERCALWCDDIAVRSLAESFGIPTFGTWALFEVLSSTPAGAWLPTPREMKLRLLRHHIADVPISLGELTEELDNSDKPDLTAPLYLFRPHTWNANRTETLRWYLEHVRSMAGGPHCDQVAKWMHAACCGRGAAVPDSIKTAVIGGVLGATLDAVGDPAMTPALLAASRQASKELDPEDQRDPLPHSIKAMLNTYNARSIDERQAAQALLSLFSEAEPDDLRTVTSILVGNR